MQPEKIVRPDRVGYWLNNKIHREDGPAIEWSDGSKFWYVKGLCHSDNTFAVEDQNGNKFWYFKGMRHRKDGPANSYTNSYSNKYFSSNLSCNKPITAWYFYNYEYPLPEYKETLLLTNHIRHKYAA